jgi:hypothetical protein
MRPSAEHVLTPRRACRAQCAPRCRRIRLAEIEGLNVPVPDTTGMAARALAAARAYAKARDRLPPEPALG